MELNSKKLERTSKLINYTVASILAIFLILLSNQVIGDIDNWKKSPNVEAFKDMDQISTINADMKLLEDSIATLNREYQTITQALDIASSRYRNEKQSFENWLKTRRTIGSPTEDIEIRKRARKLDNFFRIENEWQSERNGILAQIDLLNASVSEQYTKISTQDDLAYTAYYKAMKSYDLTVFLTRLLFVLPILLLGIFFVIKFRKHKYWPLFLGFVFFSGYVFFFGLVPYLPSYGGYIRYAVGIILSLFFGIYAINRIKAFVERKRAELKASSKERAGKIKQGTAEKAFNEHFCPSCGKDFIVAHWEPASGKSTKPLVAFGHVSSFCRHCGLELFSECTGCKTENFVHLPFCSKCGIKNNTDAVKE